MKNQPLLILSLMAAAFGCNRHDADHHHAAGAVDDCCAPKMASVNGTLASALEVTLSTNALRQNGVVLGNVTVRKLMPTYAVPARVSFDEESMAHVSTPLSGRVATLNAHLGTRVEANQTLLIIDSPELGAAQSDYLKHLALRAAAASGQSVAKLDPDLAQREADLAKALAQQVLSENNASLVQAQSTLSAARVETASAREQYAAAKKLLEGAGGIAQAEVARRESAWRTAESKETGARSGLEGAAIAWEQQRKQSQAGVVAARAAVQAGEARKARAIQVAEADLLQVQFAIAAARNRLLLLGSDAASIAKLEATHELHPQLSVRAPRAGTVVEREITTGEMASPDRPHLLILADLSRVWVLMDVPQARIATLKVGQSVRIEDGAGRQSAETTVEHIAPTADPDTRTVQVRATLDNQGGRWRPGMFVTAQLPDAPEPVEGLAIPREAVQLIGGQAVVFVPVAGSDSRFARRDVELGAEVDGWLPVQRGLKPEELVVVRGSFILKAQLLKSPGDHGHDHSDGY